MSGVFGCWQLDGRPLNLDTFRASLERLSPPRAITTAWHDGPVGIGHKSNWNSGALNPPPIGTQDVACVFDGRLDNRDELLRTLDDRSLHSESDDSDVVQDLNGRDRPVRPGKRARISLHQTCCLR